MADKPNLFYGELYSLRYCKNIFHVHQYQINFLKPKIEKQKANYILLFVMSESNTCSSP